MSPAAYKARYEHLQVPLANGGTVEMRVNQYRLRGLPGHDVDEAALKAFLEALRKHHVDMELRVDPGARGFRILHRNRDSSFRVTEQTVTGPEKVKADFLEKLSVMARYVFVGKGAPEHCQIVLQLVDHWKLAPDGLQIYADNALGLDCNGFVGNYLWHASHQQDWGSLGISRHQEGPDVSIDGYFDRRRAIRKWEDLNPAHSYIMGKVDDAGHVIPGGSVRNAGHIVITEPGRIRQGSGAQPPAVWAVESTAAHNPGLWESWYSFLGVDRAGDFTIRREDMIAGHQVMKFRIAPV
ncbi:MAG: hypothetical protein IT165_35480 [Bryobacterales bacterium]|nr:hypothetical protein [Bryobacterales bacterium]